MTNSSNPIDLRQALRLYLATDDSLLDNCDPVAPILCAVDGGVTMVQLRLKTATTGAVFEIGKLLLDALRPRGVPLIVNDRVDLMLALDADGVHVGRQDLPLPEVRRLAGDKIVGFSVNALEGLTFAEGNGADYIGVGPAFATGTKRDTGPVLGVEGVKNICAAASMPCVAIGGINASNISEIMTTGVAGCCVVSAILGAAAPCAAAQGLASAIYTT